MPPQYVFCGFWIAATCLLRNDFVSSVPVYRIQDECSDLCDWMSSLPEEVANWKLSLLAIPGSHDSGSHAITKKSDIAPDFKFWWILNFFEDETAHITAAWVRTQGLDLRKQLRNGVRYFDLRLAPKKFSNSKNQRITLQNRFANLYLVHGLYASQLQYELREIRDFLSEHPKEIVILDFQHFYKFSEADYNAFETVVQTMFSDVMIPFENNGVPTLQEIWDRKQQVVLIAEFAGHSFWPRRTISQPWANTNLPNELTIFLDRHYTPGEGNPDVFFVYQGIMTPSAAYIFINLNGDMRGLANKANSVVKLWLNDPAKRSGIMGGVRIFINDFTVTSWTNFTRSVIEINWRGLEDPRK